MRFHGWVNDPQVFPHSVISGGAAFINIIVSIDGRWDEVQFLIDTGADATILSSLDSWFVMGERLLSVDFARDPRSVRSRGVGGDAQAIIRDATLTLRSTDGDLYPIDMPVLMAEPDPAIRTAPPAPLLPSLLGRDFLRRFSTSTSPAANHAASPSRPSRACRTSVIPAPAREVPSPNRGPNPMA